MIITCGNRRLVSDRYGWTLQIHREGVSGKHAGKLVWVDDRPAHPASLTHGLQIIAERLLTDGPDVDITELADALRAALATLLDTTYSVEELAVNV